MTAKPGSLQRLLDLCDELRSIKRRIQDSGLKSETLKRLRRQSREKLKQLAGDLSRYRFKGQLGALQKELGPEHFLILATLLRRHLRALSPYVEGRSLLSSVFESSFDLLRGLELLQVDGLLRVNGLIELEQDEESETTCEENLLEGNFRLHQGVVDSFLEEIGLRKLSRRRRIKQYSNVQEYLIDLKLLHNLYQARSAHLFSPERWWRLRSNSVDRAGRAITRRIKTQEASIERCLERSPAAERFPLRKFTAEMGLCEEEVLILTHLLFLELLEGNPYADTVGLIQLVSSSEEDLMRNRLLFHDRATFRRRDIIELEHMVEGRELTSECRLSNWVVDRVLGDDLGGKPIGADEKLNFHLYLKNLRSSKFMKDF